ncbi:MAG: type II toxin-antitoxin system Phd/YefM family antitoxin [Candidatus Sungbacteria bacterium]|uniref:Type II toxin-antitoxin system Phd/YefM family antitoxin n=1 Tax=Candidatus Sungiibacteriota bacterium TaxID=2750080 RepID=A0A931YDI5_9BACT|nr:type II toxin-antitoxin system Phd/YefM family antitoxin [Candidatus Sungbacteria bacterium]
MKNSIVGLKDLRSNIDAYITQVDKGRSFIVVRKSKPVFKISPPDEADGLWESVIDFTRLKKGGVRLDDLLNRL